MQDQPSSLEAVLRRTSHDPAFRQALIDAPEATLKAEGVPLPDGVAATVVEDSAALAHLVLPPVNTDGALSDAALEGVAGGGTASTSSPQTQNGTKVGGHALF